VRRLVKCEARGEAKGEIGEGEGKGDGFHCSADSIATAHLLFLRARDRLDFFSLLSRSHFF